MNIDISSLKPADSVYVRSKGWISNAIVYISSGGKNPKECPSHEARVFDIDEDGIKLIEVIFTGKRFYYLEDYIRQKAQVWIKRDTILDIDKANRLVNYLNQLEVQSYDWSLIWGFLVRFALRKLFPRKWNWDWVTKIWDSKIAFVCSEFQNNGRRFIDMVVKENETPYDNFRKISASIIATFNV